MTIPPTSPSGPGPRNVLCAHCGAALPRSARFCGTCGERVIRDFFISYNHNDQGWAEWIAWHLEAAGHTTLIQAWDIRPGGNFIVEMDQAFKSTHRTIAVLSPDYLTSQYTTPEWADALLRDPTGTKRLLVPVRVRECKPEGWLAAVVYIDLLGQSQQESRKRLLEGIQDDGRSTILPDLSLSDAPAYPAAVVALWNVPYRRNPYFSGREALLEQVHATFKKDKEHLVTQALTGLGGAGKTQTAIEYAYRYQEEYQAVFWVQAETRGQLESGIVLLATLLNLPERDAQEQAVVAAAVGHWLETHPGWLLVLDNVGELQLLQDTLPTRGSGHILLTTRAQAPGSLAQPARVESLPTNEAAHFLLRRAQLLAADTPLSAASSEQQQAALSIVQELGGLPLALDQSGAYIEETSCTLTEYLQVFRTHRKVALEYAGEGVREHTVVGVTWAASFEQVQNRSPAAVELLRLCAYLAPEGIPEALIKEGGDDLPPALRAAVSDLVSWNTALAALRRFSLVDRQTETETLSLHRLVQVVVQEALSEAERRAWAERAVRLVNAAFPDPSEFANWERCERLVPHALACADQIERWQMASEEAARLLMWAGVYLDERARYGEVLPLYQRALAIWEQALGPEHPNPNVATSLNNLATLYSAQGQYAEALPLYQRALAILEQTLGPEHPEVARTLNNLALLYQDQGQDAEALPLFQRALAIDEQAYGPDHPEVATGLNNLALLYQDQGQYAKALPYLQRALKIREQALGPEHPYVAASLNHLAGLYATQGQYAEALPLYQRALAILEQAVGPEHPDVAANLNNLAHLYSAQGQYAKALPLLQRALPIVEQTLGPEHPNMASVLENYAALLRAMQQPAQAAALEARAQAIRATSR